MDESKRKRPFRRRCRRRPDVEMFPRLMADFTNLDVSKLETLIRYAYLEMSGFYSGHVPAARNRLKIGLRIPMGTGTSKAIDIAVRYYEELQHARMMAFKSGDEVEEILTVSAGWLEAGPVWVDD